MKGMLIAVCVLLGGALLPMPYGYYLFLRWVVCAYAIFMFVRETKKDVCLWSVFSAVIALLYNPIFRVRLDKDIWWVINVSTVFVFIAIEWSHRKNEEKKR